MALGPSLVDMTSRMKTVLRSQFSELTSQSSELRAQSSEGRLYGSTLQHAMSRHHCNDFQHRTACFARLEGRGEMFSQTADVLRVKTANLIDLPTFAA